MKTKQMITAIALTVSTALCSATDAGAQNHSTGLERRNYVHNRNEERRHCKEDIISARRQGSKLNNEIDYREKERYSKEDKRGRKEEQSKRKEELSKRRR